MKAIHGKFTSFKDMAKALNIKTGSAKTPKGRKCPVCGGPLTFHSDTNVWTCGAPFIRDDKLGDKDVQVFGLCDYFSLD